MLILYWYYNCLQILNVPVDDRKVYVVNSLLKDTNQLVYNLNYQLTHYVIVCFSFKKIIKQTKLYNILLIALHLILYNI